MLLFQDIDTAQTALNGVDIKSSIKTFEELATSIVSYGRRAWNKTPWTYRTGDNKHAQIYTDGNGNICGIDVSYLTLVGDPQILWGTTALSPYTDSKRLEHSQLILSPIKLDRVRMPDHITNRIPPPQEVAFIKIDQISARPPT